MKGFIEVTDQVEQRKVLLPIKSICFVKGRGDGCAIINFKMAGTDRECRHFIKLISDVTTVETYEEVLAKIAAAVE